MSKLNWDNAREQCRSQKYGVEIDYTVGEQIVRHIDKNSTPNKIIPVKQVFIPKTIVRSKEDQITRYINKLYELTELRHLTIISVSKALKLESINKLTDTTQKLILLRNDDEIKKIILQAKLAVNWLCNKPNMNETAAKKKIKKRVKSKIIRQ